MKSEVLEILQARGTTYTFLSQMYGQEVSSDVLGQLLNALTSLEEQQAQDAGYELLGQFARNAQGRDLGEVGKELAAEYVRLFYASRQGVSPYESVYTSEDHLLMQEARDQVLQAYRAEGLEKPDEFQEPEDHIALELAFMAYLCEGTVDALQSGQREAALVCLSKQKDFLKDHLMVWLPQFCQHLAQATRSDFYGGLAQITRVYLDQESETVDELCTAVKILSEEE